MSSGNIEKQSVLFCAAAGGAANAVAFCHVVVPFWNLLCYKWEITAVV